MSAGPSAAANSTPVRQGGLRRFTFVLLIGLWLLAIALIQWVLRNETFDSGVRKGLTAAAVLFLLLASFMWFLLFSVASRRTRLFAIGIALGAVSCLAGMFRLEGFDGSMNPTIVPRWRTKARLESTSRVTNGRADMSVIQSSDYPQFLGPNRDQSLDTVQLDGDWKANPPQLVWRQEIGEGWSSFVVVNGYAVTQEQRGDQECVSCYELLTGKLVWRNGVTAHHTSVLGGTGPRATPTIAAGKVYVMGATGIVSCLDGSDGSERWTHDLQQEMHIVDDYAAIAWGRAGSPLVLDGRVIVPVGGPQEGPKSTLIAFDAESGKEVWRSGDAQISYASPTLVTLQGERQILFVAEDRVLSLNPLDGSILWSHPWEGNSTQNASATNAVVMDEQHVFLSKSYGNGAAMLTVARTDKGPWNVTETWHDATRMKTKFSNVVHYQGHLYGFNGNSLQCLEAQSGEARWKGGRYGYGQLLRAGDKLLIVGEEGELALVAASPEKFTELGRIDAIEGKTWNNPCLAGDLVLLRNATTAACYRLTLAN